MSLRKTKYQVRFKKEQNYVFIYNIHFQNFKFFCLSKNVHNLLIKCPQCLGKMKINSRMMYLALVSTTNFQNYLACGGNSPQYVPMFYQFKCKASSYDVIYDCMDNSYIVYFKCCDSHRFSILNNRTAPKFIHSYFVI